MIYLVIKNEEYDCAYGLDDVVYSGTDLEAAWNAADCSIDRWHPALIISIYRIDEAGEIDLLEQRTKEMDRNGAGLNHVVLRDSIS